MGIYIAGVKMPDKMTVLVVYPSGYIAVYDAADNLIEQAKAVPVSPHGRLIDERWLIGMIITTLEALKKNPKMDGQEIHLIAAFDTLHAMVGDAPTIIPAEEDD